MRRVLAALWASFAADSRETSATCSLAKAVRGRTVFQSARGTKISPGLRFISGRRAAWGFSLVEVTLAIGIVSFSMLAIVAVLPVGLQTFRDSKVETSLGGIQRQVRAEAVQQWINIDGQTLYFSDEGVAVASSTDAYFAATTTLSNPTAPGLPASATNSLRSLAVKVVFPYLLPDSARTTNEFRMLLARQEGEEANE